MPRKHHKPEEIVAKLRQVDVLVSQGQNIADAIRQIGVSEVNYYRWRQEVSGTKLASNGSLAIDLDQAPPSAFAGRDRAGASKLHLARLPVTPNFKDRPPPSDLQPLPASIHVACIRVIDD